ncbi:MAG: ABC transporter permease, partial [Bacilli bacterium]|nr:ABC transporter permease [Bacilli bacterium]
NEQLVSYVHALPSETYATIQDIYGIDVTNNIFAKWKSSEEEKYQEYNISLNGLTQRYIAELRTVEGFESYARYVDLFTNFMKQYPGNEEYILNQYELIGDSTFPTKEDEIMLVVDNNTTLTDFTLAQMGYYEHDEFINIGKKAVKLNDYTTLYNNGEMGKEEYDAKVKELDTLYPYRTIFNDYPDIIGTEFYYFPHSTIWEYGNVSPETTMEGGSIMMMKMGFPFSAYYFQYSYFDRYGYKFDMLSGASISTSTNMVTYVRAPSESRDPATFFDGEWTLLDTSAYALDENKKMVVEGNKVTLKDNSGETPTETVFPNATVTPAQEGNLTEAYHYPAVANQSWIDENKGMKMKVTGLLRAKSTTDFGCLSRGVYYTPAFTERFMNDANATDSGVINDEVHGIKQLFKDDKASDTKYDAYVTYTYLDYTDDNNRKIVDTGYASALNISSGISSLFSGLVASDMTDTNKAAMRTLSGLKVEQETVEDVTTYYFKAIPQEMRIYPNDFDNKDVITEYFDRWNSDDTLIIDGVEVKRADRTDLSYTDTVEAIITMINSLITIITSALVAFTSLSLVVSCFMIAVITYISVVERVKEIGVIRSLGGRKKDVSRLFTAENLITGLASGLFGIAVTYLLSLIINIVVSFFGVPAIAMLPWWVALIMVGLSIFLNVISGFIPSRNAARQDPVEALRSE